ncbi:hypothetical protein HNP86_001987 [Methanococcus maripaludis]|uniref:Uncharacterized protein n=1 Tax=Methanococcus maripaludis TaxID=39152 RepID=A0A7J9NVW2_METMI|nr:hypothetical protein [Methanococcus maripaludis]MBA2851828.1 hypothetical protein [Methanococcus maripaludis]
MNFIKECVIDAMLKQNPTLTESEATILFYKNDVHKLIELNDKTPLDLLVEAALQN